MTAIKGSGNVWPGYVAAVASLLLSLLLVLGILVFAMTQIRGLLVWRKDAIERSMAQAQARQRAVLERPDVAADDRRLAQGGVGSAPAAAVSPPVLTVPPRPRASVDGRAAPSQDSSRDRLYIGQLHLRLIFEAGVASLPPAQLAEMVKAIQRQQVQADTPWGLEVQVPASDAVFERSAFRLMLEVQNALVAQGVAQKAIRMNVVRTPSKPEGYALGEIMIHAFTRPKPATERGQP